MTIQEIWQAIDEGKKVFWHHDGYQVLVEKATLNEFNKNSFRDGKVLCIRYLENWFGGIIHDSELKDCFIKEV